MNLQEYEKQKRTALIRLDSVADKLVREKLVNPENGNDFYYFGDDVYQFFLSPKERKIDAIAGVHYFTLHGQAPLEEKLKKCRDLENEMLAMGLSKDEVENAIGVTYFRIEAEKYPKKNLG